MRKHTKKIKLNPFSSIIKNIPKMRTKMLLGQAKGFNVGRGAHRQFK